MFFLKAHPSSFRSPIRWSCRTLQAAAGILPRVQWACDGYKAMLGGILDFYQKKCPFGQSCQSTRRIQTTTTWSIAFYWKQTAWFHWCSVPSGKRLHSNGKIHHFEWENPLFLWPFSIAILTQPEGKLFTNQDGYGLGGGTWWNSGLDYCRPAWPKDAAADVGCNGARVLGLPSGCVKIAIENGNL